MKVNIDETVEVSDEDRKAIADHLGQKNATREDLKAFIWSWGKDWRQALTPRADVGVEFEVDPVNVNGVGDDEEDLIGGSADEEDLI